MGSLLLLLLLIIVAYIICTFTSGDDWYEEGVVSGVKQTLIGLFIMVILTILYQVSLGYQIVQIK